MSAPPALDSTVVEASLPAPALTSAPTVPSEIDAPVSSPAHAADSAVSDSSSPAAAPTPAQPASAHVPAPTFSVAALRARRSSSYQSERLLGSSDVSTVFAARCIDGLPASALAALSAANADSSAENDNADPRLFCVKELRWRRLTPDQRRAAVAEAQMLASIQHPCVIGFVAAGFRVPYQPPGQSPWGQIAAKIKSSASGGNEQQSNDDDDDDDEQEQEQEWDESAERFRVAHTNVLSLSAADVDRLVTLEPLGDEDSALLQAAARSDYAPSTVAATAANATSSSSTDASATAGAAARPAAGAGMIVPSGIFYLVMELCHGGDLAQCVWFTKQQMQQWDEKSAQRNANNRAKAQKQQQQAKPDDENGENKVTDSPTNAQEGGDDDGNGDDDDECKRPEYLPEDIIMAWWTQVAVAVGELHCRPQPVLHRDIKAANVFLQGDSGTKTHMFQQTPGILSIMWLLLCVSLIITCFFCFFMSKFL